MQKNIVKRHVATKAFQHNAELHLPFPQQLPVITAQRTDGSEKQGRDRAGLAQQGLGKNWASPVRTKQPPPCTQIPQSPGKVCSITADTELPPALARSRQAGSHHNYFGQSAPSPLRPNTTNTSPCCVRYCF